MELVRIDEGGRVEDRTRHWEKGEWNKVNGMIEGVGKGRLWVLYRKVKKQKK